MRTVSLRLADLMKAVVPIGFAGENLHTRIIIDGKRMFDEYPDAVVTMTVVPPKGDPYPAIVVRDGDSVVWDVSNSDLKYDGNGKFQLAFVTGEIVAKSFEGNTRILPSVIPVGEIPDPIEDWIIRADEILDSIPGNIENALVAAFMEVTAQAQALEPGSDPTASFNGETKVLTIGVPPGRDGHDGVSPTVTITDIAGGHRITITDNEGSHSFDVFDGKDGEDGHTPVITADKAGKTTTISVDGTPIATISDGEDGHSPSVTASKSGGVTTISVDGSPIATIDDGQDGVSPTVAVTEIIGGHKITITDKNGDHVFDVMDGDPATIIDDTAGSGDTDKVWSADKSASENQAIKTEIMQTGAYYIDRNLFKNQTSVNSNASNVINAAIIDAQTKGLQYCVIPEGEYWITQTIYLKSDVVLCGCGIDATTLKIADGCDIDAIRVDEPVNNSGLMDLAIDGNRIENYSVFVNGHHGNAINVWLHYGRIERVRTNWVFKHSLLLNYDTGNSDDGLGFSPEHQNDMGNLNKVLWCDFKDSLLQGVMWGWRTMDSWMCYTNIGSHSANLYLEGGTSRFIGNHFDGDGDNGAGPEYNVYCGDGCRAMVFEGNIFENTQKENVFFRQPSYSNQTMTITIANNIIRTCSKSQNEQYANIKISGYSGSVPATEIIISGNQILNPDTNANHGYAGIHLLYCENSKVVGNTFFNVGNEEVLLDSTCENVLNDSKMSEELSSVKNEIDSKAPVIVAAKSGSIVTLTDTIPDEPLTDCVVQINPVQSGSGDPSPGITQAVANFENGTIKSNGQKEDSTTRIRTDDFVTVNAGGCKVTFDSGKSATVRVYKTDGTYMSDESITSWTSSPVSLEIAADRKIKIVIRFDNDATIVPADLASCTLLHGINIRPISGWTGANIYNAPTDDPDDPDKETHNITWQTEAGTVFGAKVNPVTGVLTVTYGIWEVDGTTVAASSLEFVSESSDYTNLRGKYVVKLIDLPNDVPYNTEKKLCSHFGWFKYQNRRNATLDSIFFFDSQRNVKWASSTYTTLEQFNGYLQQQKTNGTPVTLVCELGTPITYQLTPVEIKTLLSNPNNIWADTGDVSVSYKADTKQYVDQHEGVTDVQVNGSSVVMDGVANVPIADGSTLGVMKPSSGLYVGSSGALFTNKSTDTNIKSGTDDYKPIVSSNQHKSVFYGLAKLAGADMASLSSVTVGQYPEAQKAAIRKMLGIPNQTWEKIAEYTVPADSAQVNVNTDLNGQSFKLSEMYVHVILEPATTGANDYVSFRALVTTTNDSSSSTNTGTRRYMANGAKTYAEVTAKLINGICVGTAKSGASFQSGATPEQCSSDSAYKSINGVRIAQYSGTSTLIPKDSVIEVYGIRIDE